MNAALAIASREFVRTLRQPAALGATLLTPIMVWVLFSGGLAGAFAEGTAAESLIPGAALLVVLFGSLYAGMTLADERERAFVRTLTAEGVSPASIASGKLFAGAALSCAQAMLVVVLISLASGSFDLSALPGVLCVLLLASFAAGGVSAGLACFARTSRALHWLTNLVLMPAWLLSGALFPLDGAAGWVRATATVNPAAWAHAALVPVFESGPMSWTSLGLVATAAAGGVALAIVGIARGIGSRAD